MADQEFLVDVSFDVDESGAAAADNAVGGLQSAVEGLAQILIQAAQQLKAFFQGTEEGAASVEQASEAISEASQAAEELSGSEEQAAQAAAEMAESQDQASGTAAEASQSFEQAADSSDDMATAMKNAGTAASGATPPVQSYGNAARQAAAGADQAAASIERANEKASMKNAQEGSMNLKQLNGQFKKATQIVKKFIAVAAAAVIGSSIKQAFLDVMKMNEGLAKTAKTLKMTVEQARAHQIALATMGKTAEEIKNDKSLQAIYNDLTAIGKQLALPETAQGLTAIQDLKNGLMQLKVVGNYALQWIYYKIQSVASGPLKEFQNIITGIKDWLAGNMETISTAIATAFGWIVQIFNSLIKMVGRVIQWFDKLPTSIKTAFGIGAAAFLLWVSPLARIIALVAGVLLLIDDLETYMEGGDALFGDFWGACIEWINKISPAIDAAVQWIDGLIQKIGEIIGGIIAGIESFWQTLQDNGTLQTLQSAFENVFGIISGLVDMAIRWFSDLFVGIDTGSGTAKSAFSYVCDAVAGVIDIVAKVIEWVTDFITKIGEIPGVMETINGVIDTVAAVVTGAWEIINGIIQAIIALLNGDLSGAWEAVSTAASGAWDLISSTASQLWEGLQTLFAPVGEFFSGVFQGAADLVTGAWESISGFFSGIWESITTDAGLTAIGESISGFFSDAWSTIEGVWSSVAGFFSGIWESITSDGTLTSIGESISGFFTSAWEAIQSVWNGVVEFFSGIWESITGDGTLTGLGETISGFFSSAWETIKGVWDAVIGFFAGIWSGITEGVAAVGDAIAAPFSAAWEAIKGIWDGVAGFFSGIWESITGGNGLAGLADKIAQPFRNAWSTVESIWSSASGFFTGIWESIFGSGENLTIPQVYTSEMAASFKQQMGRAGQDMASTMWYNFETNAGQSGSSYQAARTTMLSAVSMIAMGFQDDFESAMKEWGFDEKYTAYFSQAAQNIIAACTAPDATVESVWQSFHDAGIQITSAFAESLIGAGADNIGVALALLAQGVDQQTLAAMDMTHLSENLSNYMNETGMTLEQVAGELINGTSSEIAEALGAGAEEIEAASQQMTEAAQASAADAQAAADSAQSMGEGVTDAAAAAIESGAGDVQAATESIGESIDGAISSLPEEARPYAEQMMQAMIEAIASGDPAMQAAIETASTAAVAKVEETLSSAKGAEIAAQFISGIQSGLQTIKTAFNEAVSQARTLVTNIKAAIKPLPGAVSSTFGSLKSSITSQMASAATAAVSSIDQIIAALNRIPKKVTVGVETQKKFGFGGKVTQETEATVGDDGTEYIIPVTKPGRAISLLKQAANDLGLTVSSAKDAAAMLGGSGTTMQTPAYGAVASTTTNTINNYNNVSAPATFNVHGTDAKAIADNVNRNHESVILRNIKTAIA